MRLEASCPKCGGRNLRRAKGNRYVCISCGYEFYSCPRCGEAFEQKWQLASHMRSHKQLSERELLEELRRLRELLEEVAAGQRLILSELNQVLNLLRAPGLQRPEPQRPELGAPPADLPEFARDNPWLRILRARGEEGG